MSAEASACAVRPMPLADRIAATRSARRS